ncbi:hypothetical protein [Sorangium sp. So ce1099]|uniref:RCC1 domain-containing protein n=1 Tax=Sorangium sp. So ce1099 TaxID=3133331 RepID=UPI003F607564
MMHWLRSPTTALGLLTIALGAGCSPTERDFVTGTGGQGGAGGAGNMGGADNTGGAGGEGQACDAPEDCPAAENASPTCEAGTCGLACDAGFLDCDPDAPGCESSVYAPEHCGACGNRCATVCVEGGDGGAFCNDPIEISAGLDHTCALRRDGSVWCWGRNTFGEVGIPASDKPIHLPAQVPLPGKAIHVAAGGGFPRTADMTTPAHSCAVMEDTTVICWGSGAQGQLGDGAFHASREPAQVVSLVNVVQLSLGGAHSCAVKTGDELYCWGSDADGQLGNGASMQDTHAAPTLILSDIRQVASGQDHTCAIKASDGGVLCWGRNSDGQLGIGSREGVDSPVPVDPPLMAGVDEVVAGDRHTCARKGVEVYCFGNDYNGAVGIGYFEPVPEPKLVAVPRAMHIDIGRERSGAVSGDARELLMWGVPHLGDGGTELSPRPVRADIDGVAQLAVGYYHTCALKTTGEVLCWGENNNGQLGVGVGVAAQPSPVLVRLTPP